MAEDTLISAGGGGQFTGGGVNDTYLQVRFPLPVFGPSALWSVEFDVPVDGKILKAAIEYMNGSIVPLTFGGLRASAQATDAGGGSAILASDSFVPPTLYQTMPATRRGFWGAYIRFILDQSACAANQSMYYMPGGDLGLVASIERASTLGGITDKVDAGSIALVTDSGTFGVYPFGIIAKDGSPALKAALKPSGVHGDSITYGFGQAPLSGTLRAFIQAGIPCVRVAANSSQMNGVIDAYATPGTIASVDRICQTCYAAETEHGINDVNSGGSTPSALATKAESFCTNVKARGLTKAFICTLSPLLTGGAGSDTSSLGTQVPLSSTEARRAGYGDLIRATPPAHADTVWDREGSMTQTLNRLSADSGKYRIDGNTATRRPNGDNIHPSELGEAFVKIAFPTALYGTTDFAAEVISARLDTTGTIITALLDVPTALQDAVLGLTDPGGITVSTQFGGSKTVSFVDVERYTNGNSAYQPMALKIYLRDTIRSDSPRVIEGTITVAISNTAIRIGTFYLRDQSVTVENESTARPPLPGSTSFFTDDFARTTAAGTVGNGWDASSASGTRCDGSALSFEAANQIVKRGASVKWPSVSLTVNPGSWTNPNQDDGNRLIEIRFRLQGGGVDYYFAALSLNQSVLQGYTLGHVAANSRQNYVAWGLNGPDYSHDLTFKAGLFKTSGGKTGVWLQVLDGATEVEYLTGVDTAGVGPQIAGDIALVGGIGASGGGAVTIKDISLLDATTDTTGPVVASGQIPASGTLAVLTTTETTWQPVEPEGAMTGFNVPGKTATTAKRIGDGNIGVRFGPAVGVGMPDRSLSYSATLGNVTDNHDAPANPMATQSGVTLTNNSLADDGGDESSGRPGVGSPFVGSKFAVSRGEKRVFA